MNMSMSTWIRRCVVPAALVFHGLAVAAAPRVLDDFNAGDQLLTATSGPSFGIPVPGVFTDNRILLLVKADASSATSIGVGGGRLTWVDSNPADFGAMYDDRITTPTDLSAYNAFQLTVVEAPASTGTIDFMMVFDAPGITYSARATAAIPSSGVVTVPFSMLTTGSSTLPINLTRTRGVGLEFGNGSPAGTFVFDDFLAVTMAPVPEPASALLMAMGLVAVALGLPHRRRAAYR